VKEMRLATTLKFDFPHKADSDLGGNSRCHWRKKYNKLQADKNTGWAFTLEALTRAGTYASEFLTHDNAYSLEDALPLQLIFRRYYVGTSKEWDDDNLLIAYKGIRDGICKALAETNDRRVRARVEQRRSLGHGRLEIEIIPNWYAQLEKAG
jgi:hypothetical protein